MVFFPTYLKFDNKKILVVGGGKIAADKVKKLLDFTTDITIIAKNISSNLDILIKNWSLKSYIKKYDKGDIEGFDIVIVAVDNIDLQKKIYKEAKKRGILCNAVDSIDYCDFIFPAYIKRGDITISISTSGASPALAKGLKEYIEKILPKDLEEFAKELKKLRQTLPKGSERMRLLGKKVYQYFMKKS